MPDNEKEKLSDRYFFKKKKAVSDLLKLKRFGDVSLKNKYITHFVRRRRKKNKLDLLSFDRVLDVNCKKGYVEAEGLTSFLDILNRTLEQGYMPAVVPDYRNITIGGAISGLGVEATSFRYGMVHENLLQADVLTGSGKVIEVSEKKNAGLFAGLINSLGTLGYITRCKIKIIPVKKYVYVKFNYFNDVGEFFKFINKRNGNVNFLDGIIFGRHKQVVISGYFSDKKKGKLFNIYETSWFDFLHNSKVNETYVMLKDYIWRWDADVFWGTRELGRLEKIFKIPIFRKTILRPVLRSDRLLKLHHFLAYNFGLPNFFTTFFGRKEQLIQDVGVYPEKSVEFMKWFDREIAFYPLWICPVKRIHPKKYFPLFIWKGDFINDFGFYGYKKLKDGTPAGYYNKKLEKKLRKIQGVKGLYSTSFYSKDDFWKVYDHKRYQKIKRKYDPDGIFPDLYEKAVGTTTK